MIFLFLNWGAFISEDCSLRDLSEHHSRSWTNGVMFFVLWAWAGESPVGITFFESSMSLLRTASTRSPAKATFLFSVVGHRSVTMSQYGRVFRVASVTQTTGIE